MYLAHRTLGANVSGKPISHEIRFQTSDLHSIISHVDPKVFVRTTLYSIINSITGKSGTVAL